MSPVDRQGGEPTEREWLEGLRYEDKFPDEGREARNHEAEVEAVARALTKAGVSAANPVGDVFYDYDLTPMEAAEIAIAALDAVRCAQGRDTDAPEVDRLRAGISFVRGLCTDRASYAVIDERLGELLDGETT